MAKPLRKPKKKGPQNGYKMPDPLPEGEILTDLSKKTWRLGKSIGKGGFGEIYSAQEVSSKSTGKYPYVIKIEPHENGPLFVEMHVYMKIGKKDDVQAFKNKHKLKTLGMPTFIGAGSHDVGNVKYRFIVMEQFGSDIDKLLQGNGGFLPPQTVFQLAWQMTFVLQYIHESGYVHADIKGGNILMGLTPETKNQAYLVDFGLATKFTTDKEFKPNPKKAHDGTIEYLSRDAHQGVATRRGDMEILAYNIIHWLGGNLPWLSNLKDPKLVQQNKEECMKDIPKFLKLCFEGKKIHDGISKFLKYINTLSFKEEPNYKKIRDFFKTEVENCGSSLTAPLEFQTTRKRRSLTNIETQEKKSREEFASPKPTKGKRGKKEKENDDDGVFSPFPEKQNETEEFASPKPTKGKRGKKEKENDDDVVSSPFPEKQNETEEFASPKPTKGKKGKKEKENDNDWVSSPFPEKQNETEEESDEDSAKVVVKRGKKQKQEDLDELGNDDDEEMTPKKVRSTPNTKKQVTQRKGKKQNGEDTLNEAMKEIALKKGKKVLKKKTENEEVLTDAMKEIMAKRLNYAKKKGQNKVVTVEDASSDGDGSFVGYTEEMKQIKMKKINKENDKKKNKVISSSNGVEVRRPRRNLPHVDYNEMTPKPSRVKNP